MSRVDPRVLPALCVLWLAARFLPGPADPPPAVVASLAGVRAFPSPASGRFELLGLDESRLREVGSPSLAAMRSALAAEVHCGGPSGAHSSTLRRIRSARAAPVRV